MALSDDDLNTLAVLAAEKADDRRLPMPRREKWLDVADRINAGKATRADLNASAELAELDAVEQRDAKVRDRYLALAQRART